MELPVEHCSVTAGRGLKGRQFHQKSTLSSRGPSWGSPIVGVMHGHLHPPHVVPTAAAVPRCAPTSVRVRAGTTDEQKEKSMHRSSKWISIRRMTLGLCAAIALCSAPTRAIALPTLDELMADFGLSKDDVQRVRKGELV